VRNELLHKESVQQSVQVLYGDIHRARLLRKSGPTEPPTFSAFVVERKSVIIPVENFDLVLIFIAENKERALKWIQFKRSLNHGSKPIDRLTHVHLATGEVNGGFCRESTNTHKDFNTCNTPTICCKSQPDGSSTVNSPNKIRMQLGEKGVGVAGQIAAMPFSPVRSTFSQSIVALDFSVSRLNLRSQYRIVL
jgi:hypothetical protein